MNAEAITKEVMDRIRPWLGEGADVERIHYAIERSHGSVISGLSPSRCTQHPVAMSESACEVCLEQQIESAFRAGARSVLRPDALSDDFLALALHQYWKVKDGRGVPSAQYTEGAPRRDEASPLLEEQLERLHLIASGDRDCDMSENDLGALRAVLMTFDEAHDDFKKMRAERDEALEALRYLRGWSQDVNRGPFVPDELNARVQSVLNQYATDN